MNIVRNVQYAVAFLLLPLAAFVLLVPSPGTLMEHRVMIAGVMVALAVFLSPLGDRLSLNPGQEPRARR